MPDMQSFHFVDNALALANANEKSIISFDFFDTLVFRTVKNPADVFLDVALHLHVRELLSKNITPGRFKNMRIDAEQRCRAASLLHRKHSEVLLEEIYNFIPYINKKDVTSAAHCEMLCEQSAVKGNHLIIENLLKPLKEQGRRIIIVSDIYLRVAELRTLIPEECLPLIDKVYTSGEYRIGKYKDLFSIVLEAESVNPDQIIHFGDNYRSDVEVPSEVGIQAALLPNGTAYTWDVHQSEERIVRMGVVQNDSQNVIGVDIAKVLRHKSAILGDLKSDTTFYSFGSTIMGPLLFALISQIRQFMLENPETHLGGLVREGSFIGRLYNEAFSTQQCKDLFVSRYVSRRAVIRDINPDALRALTESRGYMSINNFLSGLGFDEKQTSKIKEELRYKNINMIDQEQIVVLCDVICNSTRLRHSVRTHFSTLRRRLLCHIEKQFAIELNPSIRNPVSIALTDIGWGGSVQDDLRHIFEEEGVPVQLNGFYLATDNRGESKFKPQSRLFGAVFEGVTNDAVSIHLMRCLEIFEQSATPAMGSVKGIDGDYNPIHSADVRSAIQLENISAIQNGTYEYCKLSAVYFPTGIKVDHFTRTFMRSIMARFIYWPLNSEIQLFKDWEHDDNFAGDLVENIIDVANAPRLSYYTPSELFCITMREHYWPFAALRSIDPVYSNYINSILFSDNTLEMSRNIKTSSIELSTDDIVRQITLELNPALKGRVDLNIKGTKRFEIKIVSPDYARLNWVKFVADDGCIEYLTATRLGTNGASWAVVKDFTKIDLTHVHVEDIDLLMGRPIHGVELGVLAEL